MASRRRARSPLLATLLGASDRLPAPPSSRGQLEPAPAASTRRARLDAGRRPPGRCSLASCSRLCQDAHDPATSSLAQLLAHLASPGRGFGPAQCSGAYLPGRPASSGWAGAGHRCALAGTAPNAGLRGRSPRRQAPPGALCCRETSQALQEAPSGLTALRAANPGAQLAPERAPRRLRRSGPTTVRLPRLAGPVRRCGMRGSGHRLGGGAIGAARRRSHPARRRLSSRAAGGWGPRRRRRRPKALTGGGAAGRRPMPGSTRGIGGEPSLSPECK